MELTTAASLGAVVTSCADLVANVAACDDADYGDLVQLYCPATCTCDTKLTLAIVWPLRADCPHETDGDICGNTWKQTTNPVLSECSEAPCVAGYEPIDVSFTTNSFGPDQAHEFHGLERQAGGPSLVDGSIDHGYWFFAAGSSAGWSGGIPGGAGDPEASVEIWAYGC